MSKRNILSLSLCVTCVAILMGSVLSTVLADDMAIQRLSAGQNAFALDLYTQLQHDDQNLFFSPSGIAMALSMAYAGARALTAQQMAEALHFPLDDEAVYAAFADQTQHLAEIQKQGDVALHIANALWVQQDLTLQQAFLDIMARFYQANQFEVNFSGAPEAARAKINAWVETQTQRTITDLLPEGAVSALTRLVLTNAIYFKGHWVQQFDPAATVEAPFWTSSDVSVPVDLMQQQAMFKYGEFDGGQALVFPYSGDALAMVVLLPHDRDGLATLQRQLSVEVVETWLAQAALREVNVFLPKFRATSQFSLVAALQALDMTEAFTEDADFSGITAEAELQISDVIHKAFVDVNEAGTEAAAATGVVIGVTSIMDPQPVPEFRADHPFIFLIRDQQSGAWLFVGHLINPQA